MYEDTKKQFVEVAEMILQRKVGVIEGSRWFSSARYDVENTELETDVLSFVGIDSCTDHLPIGVLRDRWSKEGLEKSDKEFEEAEKHFEEQAFKVCRFLIEKYGKDI